MIYGKMMVKIAIIPKKNSTAAPVMIASGISTPFFKDI